MTNIIFLAGMLGFLAAAIFYLPFAILAWVWIAIQGPQQLIQANVQVNLAIVVCCILALVLNRKRATVWFDGTLAMMAIMLVHCAITTLAAFHYDYSYPFFDRMWKTMFLAVFIVLFMQNRTRLHAIVWVIVLSLGLLAVKGALFSIVVRGQFLVLGPPGSQITDNNHFAGAMCMVIPLVVYLYATTADKRIRLGLLGMSFMVPLGVLFTYSRGGLLTLLAVAGCFWLKARRRMLIAAAAIGLFLVAIPMFPSHWLDRMATIRETLQDTSSADGSVQGRFNAWYVYSRLGIEYPFTGGGFRAPEVLTIWQRYLPDSEIARAAHNNIFQVLGEHGLVGLGIYLTLVLLVLKNIATIMVRTRHVVDLRWAHQLAAACGVSMIAYMVAGLTISIPYYDLFFILAVLVASLRRLVAQELTARRQQLQPGPAAIAGMRAPAVARAQMRSS